MSGPFSQGCFATSQLLPSERIVHHEQTITQLLVFATGTTITVRGFGGPTGAFLVDATPGSPGKGQIVVETRPNEFMYARPVDVGDEALLLPTTLRAGQGDPVMMGLVSAEETAQVRAMQLCCCLLVEAFGRESAHDLL
jgi:hypothetical protein